MVLGSKEKISRRAGQELPRLDLPNTTKFTFSGLRIHDPQVTGPCGDPSSFPIQSVRKLNTQIPSSFLFPIEVQQMELLGDRWINSYANLNRNVREEENPI